MSNDNIEQLNEQNENKDNSIEEIISKEIDNKNNEIKYEKQDYYKKKEKRNRHILVHGFLFIVLITSFAYFVINLFFNNLYEFSLLTFSLNRIK